MKTARAESQIEQARNRDRTITQSRRASTNRQATCKPPSRYGESPTTPAGTKSIRPLASVADSMAIERLRHECMAAISGGQPTLDIDLEEVREANTRLVACLLLVARAARDAGARLTVHTSRQVRTWRRVCAAEGIVAPAESAISAT